MAEWQTVRLGEMVKTNQSTYSPKENWQFVNYLDTGNITMNKIDEIQNINTAKDKLPSRARRKVKTNSIIYSTVRPNQLHYGIIKKQPDNFLVSTGFTVIDVNYDKAVPDFIYYALTKQEVTEQLQAIAEQSVSAYPSLKPSDIENLELMLPDKKTQERIVAILRSIDEKIKENNAINNNLEQQAQAVYYKMFSEVNTVPVELSSIIDVRDGTHDSPKAQATGYYLITSKHLLPFGVDKASANHISKADFDKINERSLVETQDILMSMIGTIGLISYIPYETVDFAIKNVALFKTSHTPELAYYFLCYLKSEKTLQHIGKCLAGSTQKYISLGELRKMPIYSPTANEIREFNCLVKPMFEKIVSRTYENALLAEMRDSLLPKLMSGELDVSNIEL